MQTDQPQICLVNEFFKAAGPPVSERIVVRVNLLLNNPGDIRSGYLNIDPFAPDGDEDRTRGDGFNLDHCLDGGEASEIVAHDILDFAPSGSVDAILGHWLSKLKRGGRLTLSVIDLREISRAFMAGVLPIEEASELIHGEQTAAWQTRKASFTLSVLAQVLRNKGYKIVSQRVQNYRAVVTCERP